MKKIAKLKLAFLKKKSIQLRLQIIEYTKLKSSFLGSCFSCLDLIIYLYNHFLKINKKNISQNKRDTFILSKGHAAPSLYAVLKDLGIINKNLFLSGAHTKTTINIWSMEGAIESGKITANHILHKYNKHKSPPYWQALFRC